MTVVIDVSGAMEVLLQREKAEKICKILQESTLVITPDLYVSELTNTLWKYFSFKALSQEECFQFIQQGIKLVDKFVNSKDIWEEAFSEGVKNKHSIYDMLYMVTARRNNGTLITNDSELVLICKKNQIQIVY